MFPTTDEYKAAVYAPTRRVTARVTFDISDVTAEGDVSSVTTTTELASISQKNQVNNDVYDSTYNLATLEQDRFKLDGSFSFPDSVTANNGETGFVSNGLSQADGVFSAPPFVQITLGGLHTSAGITVTFDRTSNEYATDFNVTAYDAADAVIESIDVTGNTLAQCAVFGQFDAYKKVKVTVNTWSVGNRRARVMEIDFGFLAIYDDEKLISCGLVEEMDMVTGSLPSPEFRFTVDNSDRLFNILNPSGYVKYLQQRQQVIAELGVEVAAGVFEYVPLGKYILWDWTSEEGSLTASFTARTNLDLMANFFMENLTQVVQPLGQMARNRFAQCGITNFYIDPALETINTDSLVKRTDCRTVLQMIAIAGQCNLYVSRDNIITLKRVAFGSPADRVDFDNIYNEPKIELEKVVKQVDVTYWTDLDTPAVSTVTAAGVDAGDVLKLESNTLINNSTVALAVANWIMAQKQYRAKYSVNWRGNPAHELSDVIALENSYGADMDAMITKTELTYEGYLQARTEAHGAVN